MPPPAIVAQPIAEKGEPYLSVQEGLDTSIIDTVQMMGDSSIGMLDRARQIVDQEDNHLYARFMEKHDADIPEALHQAFKTKLAQLKREVRQYHDTGQQQAVAAMIVKDFEDLAPLIVRTLQGQKAFQEASGGKDDVPDTTSFIARLTDQKDDEIEARLNASDLGRRFAADVKKIQSGHIEEDEFLVAMNTAYSLQRQRLNLWKSANAEDGNIYGQKIKYQKAALKEYKQTVVDARAKAGRYSRAKSPREQQEGLRLRGGVGSPSAEREEEEFVDLREDTPEDTPEPQTATKAEIMNIKRVVELYLKGRKTGFSTADNLQQLYNE